MFLSAFTPFHLMKVIKFGGSAITDKSEFKCANLSQIKKLAQAISTVWREGMRDLVIVHGAGSFGHALVLKHGINDGITNDSQRLGFADTHQACSSLSSIVVSALIEQNVPAVSISPNSIITQKNKRIVGFDTRIINEYLSKGYLPVLYGDMVPDLELEGSVCSGDQIMSYLGKDADYLIFTTNVDGVLDGEGNVIAEITAENFSQISAHLKETKNDVTGAMKGKINELLKGGVTSYIINAGSPERLVDLLHGKEAIGTMVRGKSHS